jgi:hypothetical protein
MMGPSHTVYSVVTTTGARQPRGARQPLRCCVAAAMLLIAVACAAVPRAAAQGLLLSKEPVHMGATGELRQLTQTYSASRAWREAFKRDPSSACSPQSGSLCASGVSDDADQYGQLVVATSPIAYSSASPASTGGFDFVPHPGDQRPCASCTGFAVAAAAQAAIAAALQRNASKIEPLSAQDLQYCSVGAPTSCTSGWTLPDVLKQLVTRRVAPASCVPYDPPPLGTTSAQPPPSCRVSTCTTTDEEMRTAARVHTLAAQGTFAYQSLFEEWAIAKHIREYGAVISRFDLYDDFKKFFADPKNAKAVYKPSKGAKFQETHAVVIVGYNLTEGSWLCLNSWGPNFADNGLFRVAFGAANIAQPPDVYGITWTPTFAEDGQLEPGKLPPLPGRPGCVAYTAKPNDFLSRVALLAGLPLPKLLLDNAKVIADLDTPIAGKTLALCGMKSRAFAWSSLI